MKHSSDDLCGDTVGSKETICANMIVNCLSPSPLPACDACLGAFRRADDGSKRSKMFHGRCALCVTVSSSCLATLGGGK